MCYSVCSVTGIRHHHQVVTRGLLHGNPTRNYPQSAWTMLRPISWFHKVKLLCIPRIQNLVLDCMSNVQSKSPVDFWPQQKLLLVVTCFVVDSPVLRASTNTSLCIFWEYMPGFHSPDVQANVKMKSLEKSLTRCLHPTRHVIDSNEN